MPLLLHWCTQQNRIQTHNCHEMSKFVKSCGSVEKASLFPCCVISNLRNVFAISLFYAINTSWMVIVMVMMGLIRVGVLSSFLSFFLFITTRNAWAVAEARTVEGVWVCVRAPFHRLFTEASDRPTERPTELRRPKNVFKNGKEEGGWGGDHFRRWRRRSRNGKRNVEASRRRCAGMCRKNLTFPEKILERILRGFSHQQCVPYVRCSYYS